MADRIYRRPVAYSDLSNSQLKNLDGRQFIMAEFHGINNDKNFVTVDQTSFEDSNNIYVNKDGQLSVRPPVVYYDNASLDGMTIVDIIKVDSTYFFMISKDNYLYLYSDLGYSEELIQLKTIGRNAKIYNLYDKFIVFDEGNIWGIIVNKNSNSYTILETSDIVYIPNSIDDVFGDEIDKNIFTNNTSKAVIFRSADIEEGRAPSDDSISNKNVQFRMNGKTYTAKWQSGGYKVFIKALYSGDATVRIHKIKYSKNGTYAISFLAHRSWNDSANIANPFYFSRDGGKSFYQINGPVNELDNKQYQYYNRDICVSDDGSLMYFTCLDPDRNTGTLLKIFYAASFESYTANWVDENFVASADEIFGFNDSSVVQDPSGHAGKFCYSTSKPFTKLGNLVADYDHTIGYVVCLTPFYKDVIETKHLNETGNTNYRDESYVYATSKLNIKPIDVCYKFVGKQLHSYRMVSEFDDMVCDSEILYENSKVVINKFGDNTNMFVSLGYKKDYTYDVLSWFIFGNTTYTNPNVGSQDGLGAKYKLVKNVDDEIGLCRIVGFSANDVLYELYGENVERKYNTSNENWWSQLILKTNSNWNNPVLVGDFSILEAYYGVEDTKLFKLTVNKTFSGDEWSSNYLPTDPGSDFKNIRESGLWKYSFSSRFVSNDDPLQLDSYNDKYNMVTLGNDWESVYLTERSVLTDKSLIIQAKNGTYEITSFNLFSQNENWQPLYVTNDGSKFIIAEYYYNKVDSTTIYINGIDEDITVSYVEEDASYNYYIPSFVLSSVDKVYTFSIDNKLYQTEYADGLLYLRKSSEVVFPSEITNMISFSDTSIGVFTKDRVYEYQYSVDLTSQTGYHTFVLHQTKLQLGCLKGSDIIHTYDGSSIIMSTKKGIAALNYQQFVQSTEQVYTFISGNIDDLYEEWTNEYTNSVKIVLYKDYILFYQVSKEVLYVYDIRYTSWWKWTLPNPINKIIEYDRRLCILMDYNESSYTHGLLCFKNNNIDEYKDWTGNNIHWNLKSQPLHFGAPNNYKEVSKVSIITNMAKSKIAYELGFTNYRNLNNINNKDQVMYDIITLSTIIKKVSFVKTNAFQFSIESIDEHTDSAFIISSITVKYRITEVVR